MPRELNLTPVWFHRMDAEGNMLEWDAAWPILHYEQTADGGDDFRIRPLYRRVTHPSPDLPEDAFVDHQFLWPLGRVQNYSKQKHARLFPLWSWRTAEDENGEWDNDWYLLFPFIWGGSNASDDENYFAVFPFYADIPEFLSYRRFQTVLFPLWVGLEKTDHYHQLVLWPLIGWGDCAEDTHSWFRVLPFYGYDIEAGRNDRRFFLWPFFTWSDENLDAKSGPVSSFFAWPFFGWRSGPAVNGWTVLWPLFSSTSMRDQFFVLKVLWPIFRYYHNVREDNVTAWWVCSSVAWSATTRIRGRRYGHLSGGATIAIQKERMNNRPSCRSFRESRRTTRTVRRSASWRCGRCSIKTRRRTKTARRRPLIGVCCRHC